jgi:hypothetical protein
VSHPGELRDVAQWWSGLAEALVEAARRIGQLAEQVGRDWPDGHGREWAERAGQIGAGLACEAGAAAEVGADYARRSMELPAGPVAPGSFVARRPGMRLGGTEAHRVDDELGIRIAQLPEPPH